MIEKKLRTILTTVIDDVGSILRITGQNEKINAKAGLAM